MYRPAGKDVGARHCPEEAWFDPLPGDRFLLCSDGLGKTLPESEMASLLAAIDGTPPQAVIDAALALDASDNVTAVMVAVS